MTDLELFARLIQCEAGGEGDNGMKAVASVVMNRVRTSVGEYGRYNTIPAVIYQDGQFNCVRTRLSGRTNLQNIYNMAKPPSPSAVLQGAFPLGKIADAKPSNSATESTPPLTHGRHRAMLMMYTQGGTYFHDTRTRQGCRHDTRQYSAAIY